MMEMGTIPPCVPTFIAAYWGIVRNGPYADPNEFTEKPAIYLLMENLGVDRALTLGTKMRRGVPPNLADILLFTFASITSLYTMCRFVHGDLHAGNVMICSGKDDTVGLRIVGGDGELGTYLIRLRKDLPRLIDFGFSTMIYRGTQILPNTRTVEHLTDGVYVHNPEAPSDFDDDADEGGMSDFSRLLEAVKFMDSKFYMKFIRPIMSNAAVQWAAQNNRGVEIDDNSKSPHLIARAHIPCSTILHILLDAHAKQGPIPDSVTTYDIHVDAETWGMI